MPAQPRPFLAFRAQPLQARQDRAARLRSDRADLCPMLMALYDPLRKRTLQRTRFFGAESMSMAHVQAIVRRELGERLLPTESVFLFARTFKEGGPPLDTGVLLSRSLGDTYSSLQSDDHFLYLVATTENAFGHPKRGGPAA